MTHPKRHVILCNLGISLVISLHTLAFIVHCSMYHPPSVRVRKIFSIVLSDESFFHSLAYQLIGPTVVTRKSHYVVKEDNGAYIVAAKASRS